MNHAIDITIRRMAADVVKIAEEHGGLLGPDFVKDFTVLCTSRGKRSRGGVRRFKDGVIRPMININRKKAWWYEPNDETKKTLKRWMETDRSRKKGLRYHKWAWWLEEGKAVLGEYASIADDPDIGDMSGDPADTDKVLANVICHEVAHAINHSYYGKMSAGTESVVINGKDYGRASGSAHGHKWREIYRVLRKAYVATGAYKEEPKPKIKLVVDNTKADGRMELIGLPLFDIAA
jgi:hypothetical protein